MSSRVVARVAFLSAAVLAGTVLGAPPADAECVHALVYVTRQDQPPIYVLGPDPCLYETPWHQVVFVPSGLTVTNLPPGTPNGYVVDIRIPVP